MPIINNVQNQRNTPALYTDVLASQPAAGFTGRLFVSSDTFALYRDNGTGWDLIGGPGTGTITGFGTAGKLTKFTAASVIGDSIISESGSAISVAGSITGTSLIKSGGTSSQFLKADGSVDSNTYLTASGAVTSITGTANQVIASASVGAVTLSLPQNIGTSSDVSFGTVAINGGGMGYVQLVKSGSNTLSGSIQFYNGAGVQIGSIGNSTAGLNFTANTGNANFNCTITATGFIKSGGTSSQFLKADGSVDSNTYLTASGAVTSITGTANQVIASASVGAVTLSLPQSIATSSAPTFAGATLTGTLTMTAASVQSNMAGSNLSALNIDRSANTNNSIIKFSTATVDKAIFGLRNVGDDNVRLYVYGYGGDAMVVAQATGVVAVPVRLNVGGAADNSNFALNVSGCTYTNTFSPTASTKTANWTIGDNMTYIFTGGAGVTATLETPTTTNKIFIIKNYSSNTLTIASFNGTTNGIVNLSNTVVSSISLAVGAIAILQQSGGTHTFQII